jgi:hypothetical protein
MQTISGGRHVVGEFYRSEASEVARYRNAEKQFLRTGDERFLAPYVDGGVRTWRGEYLAFETDPNQLYEAHYAGAPQFHEVYEEPQDGGL